MRLIFKWKELFLNSTLYSHRAELPGKENIEDLFSFLADLLRRGLICRPILQMKSVCNKERQIRTNEKSPNLHVLSTIH